MKHTALALALALDRCTTGWRPRAARHRRHRARPGPPRDRRRRPRASLGHRVPAGRAGARDRAAGPPADRAVRTARSGRRWRACRRWMPGARAACSTSRSIRSSPPTDSCTCPMPSRATAATAPPWRAAGSRNAGFADVQVIFRQQPTVASRHHFGSRLVFARDGRLFVTLGERNSERARAQTLDTHLGKVVRIERDGKVPARQPVRRSRRCEAGDLVVRPPQRAGRGAAPGDRRTVDQRARAQGRRRTEPHAGRAELRLAEGHLRRRVLGREDQRIADGPGHRAAGALLGAVHRDERTAVLHGRPVSDSGAAMHSWAGSRASRLARLELDGNRVVHEETLFKGVRQRARARRRAGAGRLHLPAHRRRRTDGCCASSRPTEYNPRVGL